MLHKSKLNVECTKVESRVQTQMPNTKCRIDCAKYNAKWNIEFWRKWNAILGGSTRHKLLLSAPRACDQALTNFSDKVKTYYTKIC